MTDQVKYTNKLKGKKVLITGGTSGIGFCVAEALLESGAEVIVSSSNPERVQKAIDRLKTSYPTTAAFVSGHACDLGTESTLENNVEALFEKCGKLDHIIHTAGDSLAQIPLETASLDTIKQAGMVRFFAPLIIAKFAPKYLNAGPDSSLTLTTGSTSEKPFPGWSIITSFATGLQGMARALALDLKPIRVNVVSPGAVNTELWDGMGAEAKEKLLKSIEAKIPTGRVPEPEDIAEAYLYLLKDKNVTGSMISTNGGALIEH